MKASSKNPLADRIVLVGEDNPNCIDPKLALVPSPAGSSGARLARIFGLNRFEYLRLFSRVNLCSGGWDMEEARRAARAILAQKPRALVLLGVRVTDAFWRAGAVGAYSFGDLMFSVEELEGIPVLPLPHPSGRNLVWNDPSRPKQARAALSKLMDAAA